MRPAVADRRYSRSAEVILRGKKIGYAAKKSAIVRVLPGIAA
jgi:hypothetical protein